MRVARWAGRVPEHWRDRVRGVLPIAGLVTLLTGPVWLPSSILGVLAMLQLSEIEADVDDRERQRLRIRVALALMGFMMVFLAGVLLISGTFTRPRGLLWLLLYAPLVFAARRMRNVLKELDEASAERDGS